MLARWSKSALFSASPISETVGVGTNFSPFFRSRVESTSNWYAVRLNTVAVTALGEIGESVAAPGVGDPGCDGAPRSSRNSTIESSAKSKPAGDLGERENFPVEMEWDSGSIEGMAGRISVIDGMDH